MNAPIASTDVYTDFQGLTRLKAEVKQQSPEALRKVAEQFESIFLNMMLKSMRDANLGEGIFDNDQSKFYSDMFDQQIAVTMAKRNSFGLADALIRQLSPKEAASLSPTGPVLPALLKPLAMPTMPQTLQATVENTSRPNSASEFVSMILPAAERAGQTLGVSSKALVAQAALESGWGRAIPQYPDGTASHNLFGIKADAGWKGKTIGVTTVEYAEGVAHRRQERFRAYDSLEESFADYVNFLSSNPRYSEALKVAGDSSRFVEELQSAGYATDPNYANKLKSIIQGGTLNEALASVKVP